MNAKEIVTKEDLQYAIRIRREIHEHPELGFELPNTTAVVKRELEDSGIQWLEKYAPSSISAYLGSSERTLGLRADMDALPVEEKTGLPFSSKISGRMHACGHDSHTAILLAVARILKRNEKDLPVKVKLLFEPSEECEISGAKAMLEGGAVDDVEAIICTHCDNDLESEKIGYCPGDYMSACDPITITFNGKTAHATMLEMGIDAIAMAYDAVGKMKKIASDIAGDKIYVFSVGYFHGGTAHNVIADKCTVKISFRYYDMEMAAEIKNQCIACCNSIAQVYGGTVDIDWHMSSPAVHNDEELISSFVDCVGEILPEKLERVPLRKSTEDFAWFLTKKPGFLFRFGTGNPKKGCCGSAHSNDFIIDEEAMLSAILAFTQFVFNYK